MRAAVIDVGSSSIKLVVGELHNDDIQIIETLKNAIPIGKHTFLKGKIPQGIINQTIGVLERYKQTLQELVESIDKTRKGNLCSALRLFVLTYWKTKGQDLIEDLVDSES
jgi:cell division ATPase FtsA